MNKVTAIKHQSLADICLQETGSINSLLDFALANGVAMTYLPSPGERFEVPDDLVRDKQIFDYYLAKRIKPVSGLGGEDQQQLQQFIENGFIEFGFTQ